jgi:hypothetical protein
MDRTPKPGTIFGEHGEALSQPSDSIADLNLPPGVQALIETRVNAAVEQLREDNRREIGDLIRKHTRKWQMIAAVSVLFTLASWFIAPQQIKKWAKDYVQKRMTAPELKKAADEAIRTQMGSYVQGQIEPLKKDVSEKQQQLTEDQKALRLQVEVQELATAAKAGDVKAYETIVAKTKESAIKSSAIAALHEVEIYYDLDAAQIFFSQYADSVSKQDPGWSVEELLIILRQHHDNPSDRIAIVNTIGTVARTLPDSDKGVVDELYQELNSETDLRVRARIIRALGIVLKQEFRPLDISACKAWWALHKNEKKYQSPYAGFFRAMKEISENGDSKETIALLDETLQRDSQAVYCRAMKAAVLLGSGQVDAADAELATVEKARGDFRWMSFWKARVRLAQGKTKEAVDAINAALAKSPGLEGAVQSDEAFASILKDPSLKLPSQAKGE